MTKRKIEITNDFGEPISLRSKSDEESNKSIKIKSNDTNYRVEKDAPNLSSISPNTDI